MIMFGQKSATIQILHGPVRRISLPAQRQPVVEAAMNSQLHKLHVSQISRLVRNTRREAVRADVGFEWLSRVGEFSSNTARLTASWAGDIVADSQKRRLNYLFATS